MALGRSQSLSINTGQANSLFSQQPGAQPGATSGNLFGAASNNSASHAPKPAGSLFGGGSTTTNNPPPGTGLFGSSANANANTNANNTGSSLFGGGGNTATNNASGGGGLFGGGANNAQQQPQQSSSLFGNTANTSQPQQTSSLFGGATQNNTTTGTSSLFGNLGQSQQQQPQQPQQQTSSLFGGAAAPRSATTSLFGNSTAAQQPQQSSSLWGNTSTAQPQNTSLFGGGQNQAAQQAPQNTIFGLSASQPPSLLNASQYRNSQYAPFAGKLTYGGSSTLAPAPAAQGAVKINFDSMRPTTRFGDCIEDIQKQLEAVDSMIQAQERFCREIEAFLPKHGSDVQSLKPDVEIINEKASAVESALAGDAQAVASSRGTLETDVRDFQRCRRVAENLRMPQQFHVPSAGGAAATAVTTTSSSSAPRPQQNANPSSAVATADGSDAYDMDLINNFFNPRVADLQHTVTAYADNLSEIEAHLRVIESSAIGQAQSLAARRQGGNAANGNRASQASLDEHVRELADTLRYFEGSILGAAGLVGECREGVNGLVLGRLGGGEGNGAGRRGW